MDVVTLDDTGSSCSPNKNDTESNCSPNKDDSVASCSPSKNFAENSFSPRKDDPSDEDYVEIIRDPCHGDQEPFVPPTKRGDAPLAGILKSDIEDIDPRRYFPDYKPNETLRFSRVFAANSKPTLRNQIWWTSKTFNKNSQKSKSIAVAKETDAPTDGDVAGLDQNWKLRIGPPPKPEGCVKDDYQLLCTPGDPFEKSKNSNPNSDEEEDAAPWRFGPAQIWYDRMGVPANPKKFNYGFGLKKDKKGENSAIAGKKTSSATDSQAAESDLPAVCDESTFLPVDLLHWEDDIIIDAEEARKKIVADFSDNKLPRCGWIPTAQTRTYKAFISAFNQGAFQQMFSQPGIFPRQLVNNEADLSKVTIDANHSIFPMDNYEFETTRWEDNIIWDSENMCAIPEPRMLTLDYEDDPTIFGMPDDGCTEDKDGQPGSKQPFRQENQLSRKAEMIIMQVQQRQKQEEAEQMESNIAQIADKDPFNLSNDDYYAPKSSSRNTRAIGGMNSILHHSIPAQNLRRVFFPTNLTSQTPNKLRQHHRTPLSKQVMRHFLGKTNNIFSLARHIRMIDEQRERQKLSEGGVDIFLMREVQDLTARDGTLVMLEYCEEHPPLLSQPGMASKIRNYYKRKDTKEPDVQMDFGETAFAHTSPFLGNLEPGQCLQAVENSMYRAPVYQHSIRSTDFLLIRTRLGLLLYPVSIPVQAFIYRLFWDSEDSPRRIRMEDVRDAFPNTTESAIRKRLKMCADFKRLGPGPEQTYWVLKDDFRLPTKEDVLNMVTPEMCCAHWSMLAAEQRLRDAGFGDKYFCTPENDEDSEDEVTMEDEIKCAPWNTTKAYIGAMKGKCLLDQGGIADPTGCQQGFSYAKVSTRPQKEEAPQVAKRVVTGTNADLRKLPLKEAKEICREYGLREEELNSLTRWQIIHVIRTLSTQAAKARSDFTGMARFARGNIRVNLADMQEKYKVFCQERFELQNKILSNPDELGTDNNSSAGESDSDNDDMANKLERMVNPGAKPKKTIGGLPFSSSAILSDADKRKLEFEMEERERMDLQKMIRGEVVKGASTVSRGAKDAVARSHEEFFNEGQGLTLGHTETVSLDGNMKKLKIFRTFKGEDGKEWTRLEVISHPQLIEAYVRIRSTKDNDFIKVFAQSDEGFKEEKRREKRRLQDQLRRVKKAEDRVRQQTSYQSSQNKQKPKKPPVEKKPPPPPKPSLLKMKCSACGELGHMKTNKYCKLYGQKDSISLAQRTVGDICPSVQEEELDLHMEELIAIEGTRLKISKKLYKHAEQERNKKKALRLHIPRQFLDNEKKKRMAADESSDVHMKKKKKRMQQSGSINEESTENNAESAPSTSKGTLSSKMRAGLTLSISIGGPDSSSSSALNSATVQQQPSSSGLPTPGGSGVSRRRGTLEEADYLIGPHKSVHRRRADPRVSMASVLHDIFTDLKGVVNAEHLMFPVNAKRVPDYYNIITRPMDLQQVRKNIGNNKYELRRQFLEDLSLMLMNSHTYNGPASIITIAAKDILDLASTKLSENEQKLIELEKAINPLLDDNDMVGFSHILKEIIQECKNLPKSAAFHTRVDGRKVMQYYERIARPMDLGTIEQNIKEHKYTSVAAFRRDIEQIVINSQIYNGVNSTYTEKAGEILSLADRILLQHQANLAELERNIQRAMAVGADDDGTSMASGVDFSGDALAAAFFSAAGDVGPSGSVAELEAGEEDSRMSMGEEAKEDMMLPDGEELAEALMGVGAGQEEPQEAEDEEFESGSDPGVLLDDLALSNDEDEQEVSDENEEPEDWEHVEPESSLLYSQMHTTGQLNADLALSDSDADEDEELRMAKRPDLDNIDSSL